MRTVKTFIGLAAILSAVILNFCYAYGGYGMLRGGFLQKVFATAPKEQEECGTDLSGNKLPCKSRPEYRRQLVSCPHFFTLYTAEEILSVIRNSEGDIVKFITMKVVLGRVDKSDFSGWVSEIPDYSSKFASKDNGPYPLTYIGKILDTSVKAEFHYDEFASETDVIDCITDSENNGCIPQIGTNCAAEVSLRFGGNAS